MRYSAARTLPPAAVLRDHLNRIAWGHDALAALNGLDGRSNYRIVLLPTFTHVEADTAKGRRIVETYLNWSQGTVAAVRPDTPHPAKWAITERSKTTRGTVHLTVDGSGEVTYTGKYPQRAAAPQLFGNGGVRNYHQLRSRLADEGNAATWSLLQLLEPHLHEALAAANRYVAREITGTLGAEDENTDFYADRSNHGAVDHVALDKLAGELLYGRPEDTNGSIILRLIHRCATTNINNQPLAPYIAINVLSAAEAAIRREIGDPHIGRKVRRLVREQGLNGADIPRILEVYRKAHPRDELGKRRAIYSLTAGKTVEALASSLDTTPAATGIDLARTNLARGGEAA